VVRLRLQHPALAVGGGLLVIAADLRTEALDLVPDPLGWALVAAGAWALRVRLAGCLAAVAAVSSVSDAYLPYRLVMIDPLTGRPTAVCPSVCSERVQYDAVTGLRLALVAVAATLGAAALVVLAARMAARARGPTRARWRVLTALLGLGLAVPAAAAAVALVRRDGYDPIWNGAAEYPAMGVIAAQLWLAVELYLCDGRSWPGPTGLELPSPWAQRGGGASGRVTVREMAWDSRTTRPGRWSVGRTGARGGDCSQCAATTRSSGRWSS
jgi:hypothetical protein